MKISKIIVIIGILVIIILSVKPIVIPLYSAFFANINVINVTTEELKNYPAIERVINGKGCSESGGLCIIPQDEWNKTKNFIDNKYVNNPKGECFKFGNHDGFYSLAFNRP
jgi:hypothetical protein